jgi:integrase
MRFLPTSNSKLGPILDYYVNTVSIHKRSYKTEVYRIKPLKDLLGEMQLGEITPQHVVVYRDTRLATPNSRNCNKMLAGSTVKLELMLLSHVYSTAIAEWGMENLVNPVDKIRKPKIPPGRNRRLTPQEERKILRGALRHQNKELYAIIVLALETAMRQGEILSLRWELVRWAKRTVLLPITKNGDAREVPLSRAAFGILKNHMKPQTEGRIFSYTSNGLKSSWRVFIRSLDINDLHFHDLRHCAISSLLERGLNTIEVASISGHKSMTMLRRYSHLFSYKLVSKLDPKPRSKKERPILRDHLKPYPALVIKYRREVVVDFPDFIDLKVFGSKEQDVLNAAKDSLLRKIVKLLCDGSELPPPSSPDIVNIPSEKVRVEMISPI